MVCGTLGQQQLATVGEGGDLSNMGRRERRYAETAHPTPYGDVGSYQGGAAFLSACALVEDWGCGSAWMRQCRRYTTHLVFPHLS